MTLIEIAPLEFARLWAELVECYHGVNGFGSDTCELYAFRFGKIKEGDNLPDFIKKSKIEAKDNLFELLDLFQKEYDCEFQIGHIKTLKELKEYFNLKENKHDFDYRLHIKVLKKENKRNI